MKKRVQLSLLLTIVGLFLATSVWGEAFDPSVNIAQGKTAVSGWSRRGDCPSKNSGEVPDKAVDGSKTSHWISWDCNNAARAWIAVDLGEAYRLREFVLVWNNDAGRVPSRFLVQVATDTPSDFVDDVEYSNTGWETIAEISETQTYGESGNRYTLGAVRGRYVRFISLNKNVLDLSEFEIYADAPASDPVVTTTLVSAFMYSDLAEGSATLTLTATDHNGDALNTFLVQDQMGKFYRVTTDGSDHAEISGLDNRRYAFTVWAIEEGCLSASSISVIVGASTFDAETNLALNQPSYAVRYQGNSDRTAEKANDGSLSSLWNAGSDSGEAIAEEDRNNVWWYVDLQDQYEIKYISLYWTLAYANSFIVQVRKNAPTLADAGDDSAWETFLDYSGPQTNGGEEANGNLYGDVTGAKAAFSVTPKGRYVRFRAKGANNWGWGVQIREFRIYGNGYLPLDNTAPVISSASYNGVTADYTGVKFNITASDNITSAANLVYNVKDQNEVSHNAVYSDGVITVTDMPTSKNVTVTIYVEDEAGNHSDGYDVTITYLNPTDNLALEKSSYACQDWHDQPTIEGIDKANDGKTSTYWTSYPYGTTTNEWWYVDLGDFYDLRRIEVEWKSTTEYYSMDFSIQYRQNAPAVDGATSGEWETLASGMSGNQNVDIADAQARYICLRSASRYNSGNQLQLAELRVFGKTFAVADNEAPVISEASYNGVSADWTELKFNITVSDNVTANADLIYVVEDPNGAEHAATYSAGVLTVTGMPTFKNGDFTIYATDAVDNKSNGYVVENVSYVDPNENIALNKDAYACHTASGTETPGKAVDGETGNGNGHDWTSWGNADHTNDWWYVDLGDFYDIRRIEVVWSAENRISTDFDIQYRQNAPAVDGATASEWHTFPELAGKSGDQAIDIANTQAQYICMRSRAGAVTDQVRLSEFRVFGKAFATKDFTAPVISAASYNGVSADWTELKFNITVSDNVTSNDDLVYVIEDPNGAEHTATYSAGILSVTGMPTFKEGDITIYATDAAENKSVGYVVEDVSYVNPEDNLAVDKTRYGCKTYTEEESPAKANDGSISSHWTSYTSGTPTNEWWYVDLGDFFDIRRIEVVWKSGYSSTNYSIQYRQNAPAVDGATADEWETFSEFTGKSGNQEIDIENTKAQFICMRSSAREEGGQLRLAELRVFGKGFAVADNDAPVISAASYNGISADGTELKFNITVSDNVTANADLVYVVEDPDGAEHAASYSAGILSVTGMPSFKNRSVTIYATDAVENKSEGYVVWSVSYVDPIENLALNKSSYGSINYHESEGVDEANDGSTTTYWTSYTSPGGGTNDWWYVDLGEYYDIRRIEVVWMDEYHSANYSIQYRQFAPADNSGANASEWSNISEFTNKSGDQGIDISDTQAQFLCLRSTTRGEKHGEQVRLAELRVFGNGFVSVDAITLSESTNNLSVIDAFDGRDVDVTLARGFIADGGNYTLCLPFNMTAEQCAEAFHDGYQLWYLEDSRLKDNGDIYLNFISADNIVAGRPYLFCPAENVASGTVISNVQIDSEASKVSSSTYASFIGTYDVIAHNVIANTTNAYLLGSDNWLFEASELNSAYNLKALRAYFTLNFPSLSVQGRRPRAMVVFNEPRTDMPTDVEDAEQVVAPAKRIENGQLIIEKNGILYNAQGKRLQ